MSISAHDFHQACQRFHHCWLAHQQTSNNSWSDVRILESNGTEYLRIIKPVRLVSENDEVVIDDSLVQDGDEITEEDQEVLQPSSDSSYDLLVLYDILHSPTYQVPVLYITFQQPPGVSSGMATPTSLDDVYELLVPDSSRDQLESVGVMGALSLTDNHITGLPSYFVHPCRTAEVMHELFESPQDESSTEWEMYLLIWLGLVGGSVGLDVPTEFAEYLMINNQALTDMET